MFPERAAGAPRGEDGGVAVEAGVRAEGAGGYQRPQGRRERGAERLLEPEDDRERDRIDAPEGAGGERHRGEGGEDERRKQPGSGDRGDPGDHEPGEAEGVVHFAEDEGDQDDAQRIDHLLHAAHRAVGDRARSATGPEQRGEQEGEPQRGEDPEERVAVEEQGRRREREDRPGEDPGGEPGPPRRGFVLAREQRLVERRRRGRPALPSGALRGGHRGETEAGAAEVQQDPEQREPGVEEERDERDIEADPRAGGGEPTLFEERGEEDRPSGDRREDADRRRGAVHHIGQPGTRDPEPVGRRAEGGTHGEGVQVVVHEGDQAEPERAEEQRPRRAQAAGERGAERLRTAGAGEHPDQRPEERNHQDDPAARRLGQHPERPFEEGRGEAGPGEERVPDQRADDERLQRTPGEDRQREDGQRGEQAERPARQRLAHAGARRARPEEPERPARGDSPGLNGPWEERPAERPNRDFPVTGRGAPGGALPPRAVTGAAPVAGRNGSRRRRG